MTNRPTLLTRPYLGRADGFLTLHTGDGRRVSGGSSGLFVPSLVVFVLTALTAAGLIGAGTIG